MESTSESTSDPKATDKPSSSTLPTAVRIGEPPQTVPTRPGRIRATQACQRCRQRRERCDVGQRGRDAACTRCEMNDATCILVASRRGRYPRKASASASDASSRQEPLAATRTNDGPAVVEFLDRDRPVMAQTQTEGDASALDTLTTATTTEATVTGRLSESQPDPSSPILSGTFLDESPSNSPAKTTATSTTTVNSSRELSWAALFRHLVDTHDVEPVSDQHQLIHECTVTYLGETFPLSIVLDNICHGTRSILHHIGPRILETTDNDATNDDGGESGEPDSPQPLSEDHLRLKARGAFQYPPDGLFDALVAAFVQRFFPLYPILHLEETLQQLRSRTVPWILLHALCFVAAGVCPAGDLYRAGYTRRGLREQLYAKTKLLFDANHESNKVVLLQTTALMTFAIGRPHEYWNFWTWQTTSVTIAETLGLHRSMAASVLSDRDKSLLKRIWWFLVIRDASSGSMIGRPFRISFQQCDTESLVIADFEHDARSAALKDHPLKDTFGLYQIHMARLARLLRQIILTCYGPHSTEHNTEHLNQALAEWRAGLPAVFRSHDGPGGEIFGRSLTMTYYHHFILLNLRTAGNQTSTTSSRYQSERPASIDEAAQTILSVACDVVRQSSPLLIPHEAFPSIFLVQLVFLKRTRSFNPATAAIARAALTSCQLLWHNISESWDSGPWVMDLFDKLTALIERLDRNSDLTPAELSERMEGESLNTTVLDFPYGGLSAYLDFPLNNAPSLGDLGSWSVSSQNEGFWAG